MHWLSAITRIVEGLERTCHRECGSWHGNDNRERRARLLLAVLAMADRGENRIGLRRIANFTAETSSDHLSHRFPRCLLLLEAWRSGPAQFLQGHACVPVLREVAAT